MTSVQELCDLTAVAQRELLRQGEVSAVDLLESHLARVEQVNPAVNAIVAYRPDVGRERAAAVDDAISSGEDPGPLGGLVVAHKDLLETEGIVTTFGTVSRRDYTPSADSALVAAMRRAGAVCIGKTNTPEFGAGSHTFNDVYGMTRNPWNLERSAGGSSGGAAVSIATRMVALADGSDEGGSLRNPAAWASVVGFRPTPGVVPTVTANVLNPNTTLGPMARNVDDLALLLSVLNGRDDRDPRWRSVDCSIPVAPLDTARVAWSDDVGGLPVDTEIVRVMAEARAMVESMGWPTTDAEPDFSTSDSVFATIRAWRKPGALDPFLGSLDTIKKTVRDEYHAGIRLSAHEVDSALTEWGRIRANVLDFFTSHDLLMTPVTQVEPFPVEQEFPTEVAGQTMTSYVEWMRSCSRVTTMGAPALSLPVGFTEGGLPVGLQIVGRPGADALVLAAAKAVEIAIGPLPTPPIIDRGSDVNP